MSSLLAKARDKVSRHQDERRTRRSSNSSSNDEEYGDPIELPATTNRTATTSDHPLEINTADNNAALLLLLNKKNKQRTWSFRDDPKEAHYIQHYAPFSTLFV
jgi:hypothetical protein